MVIEGKSNNLDGVDGVIIWHERFPQDLVNQKDLKYISSLVQELTISILNFLQKEFYTYLERT